MNMSPAAMAALIELVRLQDLHDKAKAMNCMRRGAPGKIRADMLAEYKAKKDQAWTNARKVVYAMVGK